MEINSPDQPINPPITPVQPVSKPVKNKRSLFPIILGILLLLALIGGGAYYLGTQNGISGTIISHADEGYFDNIQVDIGRRTGFGTADSVGTQADQNEYGAKGDYIVKPLKDHTYNFHYSNIDPAITYRLSVFGCRKNDCTYVADIIKCSGYIEQNTCVIKGNGSVAFSIRTSNITTLPTQTLPTSQPTQTKDPTANWKTFSNKGYSFKYPQNFSVVETDKGVKIQFPDSYKGYSYIFKNDVRDVSVSIGTGIMNNIGFSADFCKIPIAGADQAKEMKLNNLIYIKSSVDEHAIGGVYNAYSIYATQHDVNCFEIVLGVSAQGGGAGSNNGKGPLPQDYAPSGSKEKLISILDNIVSTFKFLDQNQTIDASKWKAYINDLYKFEVTYPPSLIATNDIGSGTNNLSTVIFETELGDTNPPYYISVMKEPFVRPNPNTIYNSLPDQSTINKIFALRVGEELDKQTTDGISMWNFPGVYKRLPNATVNGNTFLVIENPKTYGGIDRRLFLRKDGNVFMTGITYQDNKALIEFEQFYSSLKFTN